MDQNLGELWFRPQTGLLIVSCFDLDSEYDSGVRNPNPWIQIWIWIQYCPWVGSGFKSVKSYRFGFGFGFNFVHGLGRIMDLFFCLVLGSGLDLFFFSNPNP